MLQDTFSGTLTGGFLTRMALSALQSSKLVWFYTRYKIIQKNVTSAFSYFGAETVNIIA